MPTIMVVEDSPTALYVLKDMLEGYDIIQAMDGDDALTLAKKADPDLILLDVILPKINGFEVCRRIKSDPVTSHIPVVMVTSKDRDREWGMEQGASDYITKPVQPDELRSTVARFLSPEEDTDE